MACYFPLYLPQTRNRAEPITVPCGRCVGCRLERSRQWAIRCDHERQMHEDNAFVTLTYKDEELVYGGAEHGILMPRHLELFWKRLRKRTGKSFKYFACGEYGDKSSRPHYHACIFGLDFEDKKLFSVKDGINLYTSDFLDSVWERGMCTIGDVSFESAAYVARYVMKKRLGKNASSYKADGITPEFVRMSRGGKPRKDGTQQLGIGAGWYKKFGAEVFPRDEVVIRGGVRCKPPTYYARKFKRENPSVFEEIEWKRFCFARSRWYDNTPLRLGVRYRIKLAQISSLVRIL